jgi:uncharacterized protein YjbI with pentapeptide repeats
MHQTDPKLVNWEEFKRLCNSWVSTPSGQGGTIALSGFLYQFLVSLDALVARYADVATPAGVFLETLSDLTTADERCIIATQVKSTMSSTAVSSALRELWAINSMALKETPDLAKQLSYRILARQPALKNVSAAIDRWCPDDQYNAAQLLTFKAQVEASIEPDPELLLARRLVSDFAVTDPFRKIRKWLGDLLHDPTREGLSRSCDVIAIELEGFRTALRARDERFHIWTGQDNPPDTVEQVASKDAVLTGQVPKTSDLFSGRFAPRKVYEKIHNEVELWLADRDINDRDLLEVFWISGRSGSGKSVALLHVLSELYKADDTRIIIWLGSRGRRLADAVTWARPFMDEGHQVIFAADDPFSVEQQEATREALIAAEGNLSEIFRPDSDASRPSFLFCGPTEQLRTFQDRLTLHVRVQSWLLAIESREDIEELRCWYQKRTGRDSLAVSEVRDILLVQLFFEWTTGKPIGDFARNFRDRLKNLMPDARLFDLVAAILALNRLYALYPMHAINAKLDHDPDLGSAFDLLHETEKHFVFDKAALGCRIAHPHIANAIYISWFGEKSDWRHRKSHLQQGITAALEHGEGPSEKFAPLWAIERLSRSVNTGDSAETEDFELRYQSIKKPLQEILPALYSSKFAASASPLSDLPVWERLDAALQLGLAPRPLDQISNAVSAASAHATGLRLSCHLLIDAFPEFNRGLLLVGELLKRLPEWVEWRPVAADYLRKGRLADIYIQICEQIRRNPEQSRSIIGAILSSAVIKDGGRGIDEESLKQKVVHLWLAQPQTNPRHTSRLIISGMERWPHDPKLQAAAWRLLDDFPELPSWSYVWEALDRFSANSARLETTGRDWLDNESVHSGGWDRIWEHLWDRAGKDDDGLLESALRMLLDPDIQVSWTHIWSKLWQSGFKQDSRLRVAAVQWLERISYDHGSWPYIWDAVCTDPGDMRLRLRDVGIDWLSNKCEHPGWSYVWNTLFGVNSDDADLRNITHTWLKEQGEHPSWSYVWEILFGANSDDADLRNITHTWLKEQGEHPGWSYVWNTLFGVNSDDADLRNITHTWLKEQGEHPGWSYVWNTLFGVNSDDADLRNITLTWLKEQGEHPSWSYVWEILFGANSDDADLRNITLTWLKEQGEHPGWKHVWETLFGVNSDDADLRNITLTWLKEQGEHPSWKYVWEILFGANSDDADLRNITLTWLKEQGEHPSWKYVWEILFGANSDDADLRNITHTWLKEQGEHPSWSYVWEILFGANSDDADLRNITHTWLKEQGEHTGWSYVWNILFGVNSDDADLRNITHTWLKEQGKHPGWSYVWLACRTTQVSAHEKEEWVQIGRSWIETADFGNASWGFVWRGLWFALGEHRDWLASIGMAYLEDEEIVPASWPVVWRVFWDSDLGDTATLVMHANRLIVENTPERTQTIKQCINEGRPSSGPSNQSMVSRDYTWKDDWAARWQEEGADKGALASDALDWLKQMDLEQGGWQSVWQKLWQNRADLRIDQAVLNTLAYSWLDQVAPEHPHWSKVWVAVWQVCESRGDQIRLGNVAGAWLSGVGQRVDWPRIWLALWEFEALHEHLRKIVEKRVRTSSISDDWRAAIYAKLRA